MWFFHKRNKKNKSEKVNLEEFASDDSIEYEEIELMLTGETEEEFHFTNEDENIEQQKELELLIEKESAEEEQEEYEIVEREIVPESIICPDCGGLTLRGLEFCDKCGGELSPK